MSSTIEEEPDRHIVTVDGLAGTGKTTLASELSRTLGYAHLSTGMLYRAVGLLVLNEGSSPDDEASVVRLAEQHDIRLKLNSEKSARVLLDGKELFQELYSPTVSEVTSKVAQLPGVRAALLESQRLAFPGSNLVAEGRDMGSVVFRERAIVKFWVTVDPEVKVKRRLQQYIEANPTISLEERKSLEQQMKIEIYERDERDRQRLEAPTIKTEDMIEIDNSADGLEFALDSMYKALSSEGLIAYESLLD